jgi:hypothetical protein
MIIAHRVLTYNDDLGETAVPISIYAPTEADRCWECRFEIGWPDGGNTRTARGLDGVQALYLAMQRIALELYGSKYHKTGLLRWTKPGEGYGFPIAKAGYENLIGEDRISQV